MLNITRVVLYKHGVGYFERQGKVQGENTLELQFKQQEMNDVLKSLTVLDLGGGIISSISYEGTKPFSKQLEEIALRLPEKNVFSGLLGELKGARVSLEVAGRKVQGKVLGIETINRRSYETMITDHRLILMMENSTVQSFDLLELQSLTFEEEKIQKEISHLLETLISSKKKDLKKLSIFTRGKKGKEREINVSYILETPVWKTSYRILLPSKEEEKPLVQGWALVDNTQDEDWEQVRLSLIAGLPISFVHDLYNARYRQRPVIEVEEEAAYGPPVLESSIPTTGAFAPMDEFACCYMGEEEEHNEQAARKRAFQQKVEVQKHTLEAGDFYAYEIKNPVTVKGGQSALVPILSESFEGRRIAVYNPDIREKNPMSAILFKNTTDMTLEGGPVTVMEGENYVGEAMLDTLKPEDEKIVPYAVELGCLISKEQKTEDQEVFLSLIKDGILYLHYYRLTKSIYAIQNRSDRTMELYLEHKFRKDWDLVETPAPLEKTENFYRFKIEVPAKSQRDFAVIEKGALQRTHYITGIQKKELQAFLGEGFLDEKTEGEIRKLIEMQERITSVEKAVNQKRKALDNIFDNQERLRKNLQVLGARQEEQELRQRYIGQLSEEEDSVQTFTKETEKLLQEKEELETTLSDKLHVLSYRNEMKMK